MDLIGTLTDPSVRRACGFLVLAMATVTIRPSFDPELAVRTAGETAALPTPWSLLCAWFLPRPAVPTAAMRQRPVRPAPA